MFAKTKAYSSFAVDDLQKAREFYGETLGINTTFLNAPDGYLVSTAHDVEEGNGLMCLHLAGKRDTVVYEQPGLTPASSTILNFPVDDIEAAVDDLAGRGVRFERYDGFEQDEKGIFRGDGPYIAWFKDPASNVLSVLQAK